MSTTIYTGEDTVEQRYHGNRRHEGGDHVLPQLQRLSSINVGRRVETDVAHVDVGKSGRQISEVQSRQGVANGLEGKSRAYSNDEHDLLVKVQSRHEPQGVLKLYREAGPKPDILTS